MAKTVAVLTPQEVKMLERAHAALGEFLAAQRPAAPTRLSAPAPAKRSHKKGASAGLTKAGKPRKPTGAAAHKKKLAAQASAAPAPANGGKAYPPVMFDNQQQETLAAAEQS